MAVSNKTQMVLGHDNGAIVSNGQQAPVTSAWYTIQLLLNYGRPM